MIDDYKIQPIWFSPSVPDIAFMIMYKGKIMGVYRKESEARRMADQLRVGTRDG